MSEVVVVDAAQLLLGPVKALPDERSELCQSYPEGDLDAYPISTRVNNDPGVLEPAGSEQSGLGDFSA